MSLLPDWLEEPDISELERDPTAGCARLTVAVSGERTRTWAVVVLGVVFAFEIAFLLIAWAAGKPIADLKELGTLLVTSTVTLLGTSLGFYFSSKA